MNSVRPIDVLFLENNEISWEVKGALAYISTHFHEKCYGDLCDEALDVLKNNGYEFNANDEYFEISNEKDEHA